MKHNLIPNLCYLTLSVLIILNVCLRLFNKGLPWTKDSKDSLDSKDSNAFPMLIENKTKYIMPKFPVNKQCGGLGNQMYRFASLYGIGKDIGRQPAFLQSDQCTEAETHGFVNESYTSMNNIFPLYAKHVKFITPNGKETEYAEDFGIDCCKFDHPKLLSSFQKKFLMTTGYEFHSFKYFNKYSKDIRLLFSFSKILKDQVKEFNYNLFGNYNNSHKMCVHTRRGDFIKLKYESKMDFTVKATEYLHKKLKESYKNVSITLLGADKDFLNNVKDRISSTKFIFMPNMLPRHLDMCFAVQSCNSLLITAPASTYAWWIGYLMSEGSKVYYNSNFTYTNFSAEHFPKEWEALRLDRKGNIIPNK